MTISAKTDIGLKRSSNQDSFNYGQFEKGSLTWAVVCDGMGGMAAGNVASEAAVEVISTSFEKTLSPKANPSCGQTQLSVHPTQLYTVYIFQKLLSLAIPAP